jgi:hypothetical protein
MTTTISIDKKDNGDPFWRLLASLSLSDGSIIISIDNFKYGFLTGEKFEQIFHYDTRVSLITKRGYDELIYKYDYLIECFFIHISKMESELKKSYEEAINTYEKKSMFISHSKDSYIFNGIKREEKIKYLI